MIGREAIDGDPEADDVDAGGGGGEGQEIVPGLVETVQGRSSGRSETVVAEMRIDLAGVMRRPQRADDGAEEEREGSEGGLDRAALLLGHHEIGPSAADVAPTIT